MTVEPAAVTGLTGVLAAVVVLVARTELDAVLEEGGGWEERLEVVLFAAGWAWVWVWVWGWGWGWGWEPLSLIDSMTRGVVCALPLCFLG